MLLFFCKLRDGGGIQKWLSYQILGNQTLKLVEKINGKQKVEKTKHEWQHPLLAKLFDILIEY